jgi:hypothetical protein
MFTCLRIFVIAVFIMQHVSCFIFWLNIVCSDNWQSPLVGACRPSTTMNLDLLSWQSLSPLISVQDQCKQWSGPLHGRRGRTLSPCSHHTHARYIVDGARPRTVAYIPNMGSSFRRSVTVSSSLALSHTALLLVSSTSCGRSNRSLLLPGHTTESLHAEFFIACTDAQDKQGLAQDSWEPGSLKWDISRYQDGLHEVEMVAQSFGTSDVTGVSYIEGHCLTDLFDKEVGKGAITEGDQGRTILKNALPISPVEHQGPRLSARETVSHHTAVLQYTVNKHVVGDRECDGT